MKRRLLFYVDHEMMVGHASAFANQVLGAQPDYEFTLAVYGTFDRSSYERNGVTLRQFLPIDEPSVAFEKDCLPKIDKGWPSIGERLKAFQRAGFLGSLWLMWYLIQAMLTVFLYRSTRRLIRIVAHLLAKSFENIQKFGQTIAKIFEFLNMGIRLAISTLIQGMLLLRCGVIWFSLRLVAALKLIMDLVLKLPVLARLLWWPLGMALEQLLKGTIWIAARVIKIVVFILTLFWNIPILLKMSFRVARFIVLAFSQFWVWSWRTAACYAVPIVINVMQQILGRAFSVLDLLGQLISNLGLLVILPLRATVSLVGFALSLLFNLPILFGILGRILAFVISEIFQFGIWASRHISQIFLSTLWPVFLALQNRAISMLNLLGRFVVNFRILILFQLRTAIMMAIFLASLIYNLPMLLRVIGRVSGFIASNLAQGVCFVCAIMFRHLVPTIQSAAHRALRRGFAVTSLLGQLVVNFPLLIVLVFRLLIQVCSFLFSLVWNLPLLIGFAWRGLHFVLSMPLGAPWKGAWFLSNWLHHGNAQRALKRTDQTKPSRSNSSLFRRLRWIKTNINLIPDVLPSIMRRLADVYRSLLRSRDGLILELYYRNLATRGKIRAFALRLPQSIQKGTIHILGWANKASLYTSLAIFAGLGLGIALVIRLIIRALYVTSWGVIQVWRVGTATVQAIHRTRNRIVYLIASIDLRRRFWNAVSWFHILFSKHDPRWVYYKLRNQVIFQIAKMDLRRNRQLLVIVAYSLAAKLDPRCPYFHLRNAITYQIAKMDLRRKRQLLVVGLFAMLAKLDLRRPYFLLRNAVTYQIAKMDLRRKRQLLVIRLFAVLAKLDPRRPFFLLRNAVTYQIAKMDLQRKRQLLVIRLFAVLAKLDPRRPFFLLRNAVTYQIAKMDLRRKRQLAIIRLATLATKIDPRGSYFAVRNRIIFEIAKLDLVRKRQLAVVAVFAFLAKLDLRQPYYTVKNRITFQIAKMDLDYKFRALHARLDVVRGRAQVGVAQGEAQSPGSRILAIGLLILQSVYARIRAKLIYQYARLDVPRLLIIARVRTGIFMAKISPVSHYQRLRNLIVYRIAVLDLKGKWFRLRARTTNWFVAKFAAISYSLANKIQQTKIEMAVSLAKSASKHEILNLVEFRDRHLRGFKRLVDETNPEAVILLENNSETTTHIFTHYLDSLGIPIFVSPTTIPNPSEPIQYYANDKARQVNNKFAKTIATAFPNWSWDLGTHKILRAPPTKVMAWEMSALHCESPWTLNTGLVDGVFVESPAMADHYMKLGFRPDQLAVVGSTSDVLLAQARADKLQRRRAIDLDFDFDPSKPLLLCALPPNQYSGSTDGFEFETFDEFLEAWFDLLAGATKYANVLVRPHPRLKPEDFMKFVHSGVAVSSEATHSLIPLADLYLASISATIRWALASGIPVLNYDSYRYRYSDYDPARGHVHVETLEGAKVKITSFFTNEMERKRWSGLARVDAQRWGFNDTLMGNRVASILNSVRKSWRTGVDTKARKDRTTQSGISDRLCWQSQPVTPAHRTDQGQRL